MRRQFVSSILCHVNIMVWLLLYLHSFKHLLALSAGCDLTQTTITQSYLSSQHTPVRRRDITLGQLACLERTSFTIETHSFRSILNLNGSSLGSIQKMWAHFQTTFQCVNSLGSKENPIIDLYMLYAHFCLNEQSNRFKILLWCINRDLSFKPSWGK